MKELIVLTVALGTLAVTGSALAIPTLTISDGVTTTTLSGVSGIVSYVNTNFDGAWSVVIVTGETKPVLGSACNPAMDLSIQATSLTPSPPLTISFSDNGFGPSPGNFVAKLTGHVNPGTGQNVTYNTYYDAANVTGAKTTLLTASGILAPPTYSSTNSSGAINQTLYSLTQVVTIGGAGAGAGGSYTFDASLSATNPPVFTSVPVGGSLGCNPANAALPTDASVKAQVTAAGNCGLTTTNVTHLDGGTACASNRTFTITVNDAYGNTNSTNVVYTWTANTTPPVLTCASNKTVQCGQGCTGFTTLYNFTNGSDGAYPQDGLILSGNTLYGTTETGGSSGDGTVFSVNTDGTGFTTLHSFTATSGSSPYTNSDGGQPWAGLILSGNTLYGTAEIGGSSGGGTVFSVNTDGTGFTVLHSFTGGSDGANPLAGLILSGDTFYGTANGGGSSGRGTVFRVNTNGSGFTNLHNFTNGSDGWYPYAGLILSGGTLYGTASGGGSSGYGTVFKVNTDGTGFTVLHSFTAVVDPFPPDNTNSDGVDPRGGLIISGDTLYGTAAGGGSFGSGTVFAVNTNGSGFTNLHSFTTVVDPDNTNSDGANPIGGLILSGNTLYGTAVLGGSSGDGTVFKVSTDGTGFTALYSFTATDHVTRDNSDGAYPHDGLILSGNTLYGTAEIGGSSNYGTVFALCLGGSGWSFDPPTAFDACSGTNVAITVVSTVSNGVCPQVITRTWLAIDACGNTNTCTQTVTVVNTNLPVLTCASNLTVNSGQVWNFTPPTASDACCTNLTITVVSTVTNVSFNACEINYTRTWQVTDCCTNSASCSQTVTVIATGPCQVFHTGMNGATALLGGALDPNFVLVSVPSTPAGAGTSALVMDPSSIPGGYLAEGPNSQWIGPNEFGQDQPEGVYHYQVTFLLCCTNGAEVSGQVAMDNTGGVYLNNNTQVASIAGSSAWSYWTQFTASSGFVPGLNWLDIYVTNNGSSGDPGKSQTGMRAEVTNCFSPLFVLCSSNKTVGCGSNWTFDLPRASSCCGSNVTTTVVSTVTNGVGHIIFAGSGTAANGEVVFVGNTATSGFLDITGGTNMGTYALSPGSGSNLAFLWDGLIFPTSDPFLDVDGLLFTNSGVELNLFGNGPASYSLVGVPTNYAYAAPLVTNGVATLAVSSQTITRTWLFTDACGNSNYCSQTVNLGTPASVVSTYALCGDTHLTVAFSSPLSAASATNTANYQVLCGGEAIPALTAQVSDDARLVMLTLSQPLNFGGNCLLQITGLVDVCETNVYLSCGSNTCAYSSSGTEFWLTFPGNYAPDPNNPPQLELYISGAPGIIGTVSIPGLPTPFVNSFTIPATGVAAVPLPVQADLANANDVVEPNGIHVVASGPVTIDAFDHVPYTTDAYLGLPTRDLGDAYMVMAYKNVYTGVPDLNGTQFAIVATADNTTVTIILPLQVGLHSANVPFTVTLMQGQTYQLRDTSDALADLTGTRITSDQPIAVFGSHQCAGIPSADVFFCDYLVEQLFPITMWGNSFLTVPLYGRRNGDSIRCLAWQTGTQVSVNGVFEGTINSGQVLELQLSTASQITATAPILVAQYADSSDYDSVVDSDPLMVLVPSINLYGTGYQVEIPPTNFFPSTSNFLNVVAQTASAVVGAVVVDALAVPGTDFKPFAANGTYSWAQLLVNTGPHTIATADGTPIGVTVYGWAEYDAYGYPAGICAPAPGTPPPFSSPPTNTQVTVSSNNLAAVPDLRAEVGNATAAFMIIQIPQPGLLVGPGSYPVSITAIDEFGRRYLYQTTLTVIGNSLGKISVIRNGGLNITLTWTNNALLQSASSVHGPWTTIQGSVSPYVAPITNAQGYFRTIAQ